jgi:hypothetical protein
MIGIRSLFTNEGNLLLGSAALMTLAILKILCRKVAVLIQFPGFLLGSLIYISINLAVFGLLVIVRNNDTLGSVVLDHFLSIYCNNSSVFQTFFHFGNSDSIPVSLHILIRIGLLRRLPVYFLNSLLKDHDIVLGSLFVIHHIVVILCLLITILIGIGYFKIILGIIVFTLSADNLPRYVR